MNKLRPSIIIARSVVIVLSIQAAIGAVQDYREQDNKEHYDLGRADGVKVGRMDGCQLGVSLLNVNDVIDPKQKEHGVIFCNERTAQ